MKKCLFQSLTRKAAAKKGCGYAASREAAAIRRNAARKGGVKKESETERSWLKKMAKLRRVALAARGAASAYHGTALRAAGVRR